MSVSEPVSTGHDPGAQQPPPAYWFKAKRYGWGWGVPCSPQGWMVTIAFVLVPAITQLVAGAAAAAVAALIAAVPLTMVLVRKGEPPRWRWGRR